MNFDETNLGKIEMSLEKIDFKIHTLNATNLVLIAVETVDGVTLTETITFKVK